MSVQNDDDCNHCDEGDQPPSKSLVSIAFGGRPHRILLSSSHRPHLSAFLAPAAEVVWDAHWGGTNAVSTARCGGGWMKLCAAHLGTRVV